MSLALPVPEWTADALCPQVDPDLWFPEKGESVADARRICGRCPVATECLTHALTHHIPHGIWGGTTGLDRRRLTEERNTT